MGPSMEKIAIVGLSCLFPEAETPEQYWQNLVAQKDSTSRATAEEMGIDAEIFYDPVKGKTDKYYCIQGGYVRNFSFDPDGYDVPPELLADLDNVFKWPLYVAKQALQDSGYFGNEAALAKTGVILGNLSFPTKTSHRLVAPIYQRTIAAALQELLLGQMPLPSEALELGSLPDLGEISPLNSMMSGYPSALIAQALSLSGFNYSLDAACATSLYAIKLACDHLLSRQADLMLAGAVSCADPFFINMGFSIFQAYPEDATSRPLDKLAEGLLSGEGAGMLALKRHSDAVRDGDRIYATILGVGLSNDGRGKFLLTPNPRGQILAFERAYAEASIDPKSIDYVECHATGTRLGDKAELSAMDTFFGQHDAAPLVGAVKSNLGHLLTAAGMAGMIKIILSMSEGLIPATINLAEPRHSPNNVITAEQIVSSTLPWPASDHSPAKRAAVSAFGFGGSNAHLILEQEDPGVQRGRLQENQGGQQEDAPTKMAIIGMDAFFGSCNDLDAFGCSIYDGQQHFIPLPPSRWKGMDDRRQLLQDYGFDRGEPPSGAYIQDFGMDFFQFKIPPNDADRPIPQQLLALRVADNALKDAGLDEGKNVAVIVAMGTELALHQFRGRCDLSWQIEDSLARQGISLQPSKISELETITKDSFHEAAQVNQYTSFIGNVMACRISSLWDFSGPAFTLSAEETSVFKALAVAQLLLTAREVDAVVVGGVDLAGGVESVLLRNQRSPVNTGANTMTYDRNANGWLVGEGAGAVVLRRLDAARESNDRIYAVIDALSFVQENVDLLSAQAIGRTCQRAFDGAGVKPDDIGYLEVHASGIGQEDKAEISGLIQAYLSENSGTEEKLSCAIGSVKANIGHTFAASGMASLIKTALCLHQRFIPATPGWSGPKMRTEFQDSPFYIATESRPWFLKAGATVRVAAINGLGSDKTCAHLILSDDPDRTDHENKVLAQTHCVKRPYLFPVAANHRSVLLEKLAGLQQTIENSDSLSTSADQSLVEFQNHPDTAFALAIVGHNKEELAREIQFAFKGVVDAFDEGKEWQSPLGSYFTAQPLGDRGTVAFVYPGAFNAYVGLGRDVFHLFPNLYDRFSRKTSNVGRSVAEEFLYPRSLDRLSPEELKARETQLMGDPTAIIEAGTSFALLFTMIMQDYFQLQPTSAFGYSQGEASMMWALGVWTHGDQGSDAWHASSLFKTRLSGPKDAVRELWKLSEDDTDFWVTYILRTPASRVLECLENETRVYLTIINTPREVVIAGHPKDCERVIETLGCAYLRAPFDSVLHCGATRSEYDGFVRQHILPVENVPGIDFYSADNYEPIALDSETLGHTIARVSCKQVDFPRLVNRVYDSGARIFVELGPLGTCSRWIGKILDDKEHVAMTVNRRGISDYASIVHALAKLVSHRVPLDLSPLHGQMRASPTKKSFVKTITLGGKRIGPAILTQENIDSFSAPVSGTPPRRREPERIDLPTERENEIAQGGPAPLPPGMDPLRTDEPHELVGPSSAPNLSSLHQKLAEHMARVSKSHDAFLQARSVALRQAGELIQLQIAAAQESWKRSAQPRESAPAGRVPAQAAVISDMKSASLSIHSPALPAPESRIRKPDVVWDEADLMEFAQGKIAPVFGEEYAVIDTYRRRVRLPTHPYLLVSRVTKVKGERGVYEPSSITTEYDIPHKAWYTVDGQIPWAVAVESGQCDLLLISYLGIDFENKGERVYRLLDCTLTFLDDLPREGETLRYDISIDSFARNGESLLFFFSYECFVGDNMVLKMTGGCAGFFSDKDLAQGKGILVTEKELEERGKIPKRHFELLLTCAKSAFDKTDLLHLADGNLAGCFGEHYAQNGRNPSLRLHPPAIHMIDRVVSVDPTGGAWGLGLVIAEQDLEPAHWYFPCHFKDDQVLAGSLIAEGCEQLLQFYLLYLGLQTCTQDARFQPIPGLAQVVRTRRQITAVSSKLIYQMEITEIGLSPKPYAQANIDIIFDGTVVVDFKNLGLQLSEKNPDHVLPALSAPCQEHSALQPSVVQKEPLFDESHIAEFATGSVSKCFGPAYAIYENRRVPRTPNGDLQLTSRILEVNGRQGEIKEFSSLVSEYDVPTDPWFYRQNSYPTLPYSIYMEIALQPCGFLSAYLGSTLPYPDVDFYFRNLDGHGRILKDMDVRGKTVVNRVRLLSSTAIQGVIIQKFDFQLACEDVPFYQGEAVFGYFMPQALATQAGLDGGGETSPWYKQEQLPSVSTVDLRAVPGRVQTGPGKPYYRLAHEQLNFLDDFLTIEGGGRYGQGYIYASKRVDPQDWFFSCHFYQDPVMPGSLGVEAILQAMQIYALEQDLGRHLTSPRFEQVLDHEIVWKYRGQITPDNKHMHLEVHISSIDESDEQVTIVGDASLWKEGLRIYEVKQAAIRLLEA